jgi:hypothetical protein
MTQTAHLRSTPRDAVPIAVFRDPTHDVTVVDVSDWQGDIDRSVVGRMGNPVLVCFGEHNTVCPLLNGQAGDGAHGVVFEVLSTGDAEKGFIESFSKLVDPRVPVRVISADGDDREKA